MSVLSRAVAVIALAGSAVALPTTAAQADETSYPSRFGTLAGSPPVEVYRDDHYPGPWGGPNTCDVTGSATQDEASMHRVTDASGPLGTGFLRMQPHTDYVVAGVRTPYLAALDAASPTSFSVAARVTRTSGGGSPTVRLDVHVQNSDGTYALGSMSTSVVAGSGWQTYSTDRAMAWSGYDSAGNQTSSSLGTLTLPEYLASDPMASTFSVDLKTGDTTCAGSTMDELELDDVVLTASGNTETIDYEPEPQCDGKDITVDYAEDDTPTAGDDVILGTPGADTINALDGDDTVCAGDGNDTITTGAGINHTIIDGAGDDTITTGVGNNAITKGAGYNTIVDGPGNDTITNMAAANTTYVDGPGNDVVRPRGTLTASYSAATAPITATTSGWNDTVVGTSSGSDAYLGSDENHSIGLLIGTPYNDRFVGQREYLTRDGAGGSDTIDMSGGEGPLALDLRNIGAAWAGAAYGYMSLANVENVIGTRYADVITGDSGNNVINGGGGNDNINGLGGANRLIGGDGNDFIHPDQGTDTVIGGAGTDLLDYSPAPAAIRLSLATTAPQRIATFMGPLTVSGVENVTGTRFADVLTGSAAANRIVGGAGNDTIQGMGGRDYLLGGLGGDTVSYTSATSGVHASLANTAYQYTGSSTSYDQILQFERILGSKYGDTLTGNAGNNVLNGAGGTDYCDGKAGTDSAPYCEHRKNIP